ncbi:TPA_asm: fusion protein [Amaranthus tuberculatus amalgavirus 3]|nr:TPA_asm: fusion protein [Amaranthus tuberculatus amalgavirus 3]
MAGSSSARDVYIPTVAVDLGEALRDTLAPLGRHGFNVNRWDKATVNAHFLSVKKFIDNVKILSNIEDHDLRTSLIQKGITLNHFKTPADANPSQLDDFCMWLKKPEGTKFLNKLQKDRALARRVQGSHTVSDVALVSLLNEQLSDYHAWVKETRSEYDDAEKALLRELDLLREDRENVLHDGMVGFRPAADYVEPIEKHLNQKCWLVYLEECRRNNKTPLEGDDDNFKTMRELYGPQVRQELQVEFLKAGSRVEDLKCWADKKILYLGEMGERKKSSTFVPTWTTQAAQYLMRFDNRRRSDLLHSVVVGRLDLGFFRESTQPISSLTSVVSSLATLQVQPKPQPPLSRKSEQVALMVGTLNSNSRLQVLIQPREVLGGQIPHARSKFEMRVRKVIGGGEMLNWKDANHRYRGGGNYSDALKLLVDACEDPPGRLLHDCFSFSDARNCLLLPCNLSVPCERESFTMKQFNDDATAGPTLRAFGIRTKYGLKYKLENFAYDCLVRYASGVCAADCLPFVAARVGYRTKLLDIDAALEKLKQGKPMGRCVMMLDAYEQAFSTPLYNVLSDLTSMQRHSFESGFRNTIVRASSDWGRMWNEVRAAACIVELDWKKFDRERPYEDIEFAIGVILSCFAPKNDYESRFLEGYGIMLRRSLLERPFVTDDGGVFTIHGMVPSGSLWTGWLDTALNILYIRAALRYMCVPDSLAAPKCAGDDNLTLFLEDQSDAVLLRMRTILNEWFRAGIDEEDFKIHRPPFHVRRFQAVFPPGTDLSKGTSKMVKEAVWVEIEDEMLIDEEVGLSHRWKYSFEGCPCFLSCYWLDNGSPIRPAHINLEKLLWPEGIHKTIHDYEASLIGMAVDNPFNHHNINHLMHRFCIVQQVKRVCSTGMKAEDVLFFSRIRPEGDGMVPFPMIAQWRRGQGYVEMERLPHVGRWMRQFTEFVTGVTSLYARSPSGGLDAWRFMDIIRGEQSLAERQYGNDLKDWLSFIRTSPVTKYLKPLRQYRKKPESVEASEDAKQKFNAMEQALFPPGRKIWLSSVDDFSMWLSQKIRNV